MREPSPPKVAIKPRKFQIFNISFFLFDSEVSPSGKRKVTAAGSLDLSEYIEEEPASHDITVTLRPVKENLFSQVHCKYILSSIMLEGCIPR